MPTPKDGETEKDFVKRCIPMVMNEGTAEDSDQAVAMCHSMFEEHEKKTSKSIGMKRWITVNGQHINTEDGAGSGGGGKPRGWGSARDEFRFVDKRLATGGLKPGEKQMLERRRERLAKEALGANDKSIKGMLSEMDCAATCQECSASCMNCIRTMEQCPNRNATHDECIQKCKTCIATCQMTASDLVGDTNQEQCQQSCEQCATACMDCVESLEQIAEQCDYCREMCQSCSEVCGVCAEMCQMCAGMDTGAENNDAGDSMDAEMETKSLIAFGGEIKSLSDGHIGGYLVRFGTPQDTDGDGEYFDASTDFGFKSEETITTPIWLNHCQPLETKNKKQIAVREPIGQGTLKMADDGILVDAVLYERAKYEKLLDLLGWSSGTADHTIKRKQNGKAIHVARWLLGLDASLTPKPAEPRNIVSIKSISALKTNDPKAEPKAPVPTGAAQAAVTASDAKTIFAEGAKPPQEKNQMDDNIKSIADAVTKQTEAVTALTNRLETVETALKAEKTNGTKAIAEVIVDPADHPFKSLAEEFTAVKNWAVTNGQQTDPRLKRLGMKAALGGQEGVPSEGGYLLDPTLAAEVLMPIHDTGVFSSRVRQLPVSSNSNYGWINGVNETNRSTGRWGGIIGYRLAEAGTKTASKPAFRRINWELKKFAVLIYGTDELLADAAQFSTIVRTGGSEELDFMVNDDILNGNGAAGPFGILQSPCVISVAKETNQVAATIVYENLLKMWARLTPAAKKNAVWFHHTDTLPQLHQLALAVGTGALPANFVTYAPDGSMRIFGKPVVETEFNATLGTTGDIVVADMSQYLFWEKGGVQEASSIHVQFLTDETVFRMVYRCDGTCALNAPITPYKGSNTQSCFVKLDTRS